MGQKAWAITLDMCNHRADKSIFNGRQLLTRSSFSAPLAEGRLLVLFDTARDARQNRCVRLGDFEQDEGVLFQ